MQKLSQSQLIMKHLRIHGSISTLEGLRYNIMALPRRIKDLTEAGNNINAVVKKNPVTGQRYTRYYLIGEQTNA